MITKSSLSPVRVPLRFVFWGGLLLLFDFSFSNQSNGRGFRVDFLNDFAGMILVMIGLWRIARLRLGGRLNRGLAFVFGVGAVSTMAALLNHAIFPKGPGFRAAEALLSIGELAAIMTFCRVLLSYAREAGLPEAASSWKTTFILFLSIYGIPLGLLNLAILVALATKSEFNLSLGPAGLLLLPLFFWPLIHFFVSTSRMIRAVSAEPAEERIAEPA